jgi:hypothetical protein
VTLELLWMNAAEPAAGGRKARTFNAPEASTSPQEDRFSLGFLQIPHEMVLVFPEVLGRTRDLPVSGRLLYFADDETKGFRFERIGRAA